MMEDSYGTNCGRPLRTNPYHTPERSYKPMQPQDHAYQLTERLLRYPVRATTHRKAGRFHRTHHASTRSLFWQIPLGTAFICLGFASGGLACHTADTVVRLTPTPLTYYAVQGATNPPNQTIAVSRPTTWQATFTTSDNASWLTVSPATTTITTSKTLTVAVNTTGLVAGTYRATITTKVGTWCTNTAPVTLIVSPSTTTTSSTTSSATLKWNAVTGTTVSGYKVYVGEAPRQYSRTINVGTVTSSTVSSLAVGRTYYFAVTAYNSAGESMPSTEVSKGIY